MVPVTDLYIRGKTRGSTCKDDNWRVREATRLGCRGEIPGFWPWYTPARKDACSKAGSNKEDFDSIIVVQETKGFQKRVRNSGKTPKQEKRDSQPDRIPGAHRGNHGSTESFQNPKGIQAIIAEPGGCTRRRRTGFDFFGRPVAARVIRNVSGTKQKPRGGIIQWISTSHIKDFFLRWAAT